MTSPPEHLQPALADLLLAAADDKLLLGHRNSDWTGLGPILEEDIAFSSIAQDEMAHAQTLYGLAGSLLGRTEDQLAFGRTPDAYRCASIVERSDDFDWAIAVTRQLFCDHFDLVRLRRLATSSWEPLAALAGRLVAEEQLHADHVSSWVQRLGRGTDESRTRLQTAFDELAPLAPMLLEPVAGQDELEREGLYPEADDSTFDLWSGALEAVAGDAGLMLTLSCPDFDTLPPGGRRGVHTPDLAVLLDEMCEVYRLAPDAAW